MSKYDLIEFSNNYSKVLGSLWQHYRDGPTLANASALAGFPGDSASFKFKVKIKGVTADNGRKNV